MTIHAAPKTPQPFANIKGELLDRLSEEAAGRALEVHSGKQITYIRKAVFGQFALNALPKIF